MSKPGPNAKPVELKLLEGNRGHRPIDLTSTFRPEVGMPPMPKGLSAGARKVWKRLGPQLLRYNLMSPIYADAFEDLCETIANVKELRHSLHAKQALYRSQNRDPAEAFEASTPNGMPAQHPRYQMLKAERQEMYRALAKFGLTPAEQANVTTAIRAQMPLFEVESGKAPAGGPAAPTGFAEFE